MNLPSGTQFFGAAEKKFEETVVMVPFFGGTRDQLRRHIEWLNETGYDVVAFDLKFELRNLPLSVTQKKLGLKYAWSDVIEGVLTSVGGPQLVFSFSSPSSSALIAVERLIQRRASNVKAIVFDGGPFKNVLSCNWNYMKFETKLPFAFQLPVAVLATAAWGLDHNQTLERSLKSLPEGFPILSIRGWNDPLVPPRAIDAAFETSKHLDLSILALPEGGHLNGLRNFPEEYKPRVEKFLRSFSTNR